jgi:hypothetical protein
MGIYGIVMRPLTSPINRLARAPHRRGRIDWQLFASFSVLLSVSHQALFPLLLEFDNLRLSNPNFGGHRLCSRENTHEMPPKKKLGKELSVEGPTQVTGAQALEASKATTQQKTSTEP